MNMEMMRAVLADEGFIKSLFDLETADEVQAALKEKGVEPGVTERIAIRMLFEKVKRGEISREQVEQLKRETQAAIRALGTWNEVYNYTWGEIPQFTWNQINGGA